MLYALSGVPPDHRKTKLTGQETPTPELLRDALSGVPPDRRKTKLAGQETPLSRKKDTEHTGSGSSAGFGGDPAAPAQCSFCGGAPDQKLLFS